ncbi:polyprenyl synthetase family protein [Actinoallomurus iriomotensis]|uniref:Geranylgeranyl pyrophosphate synthase n=1 Tax=Actinoallomurus iriomotensis TaxID=478107 RepID=A0A9W6RZ24_9ACTN|nr:polyprenyl synthetase family protein [Actinoallomurus iriomotensis]GLY82480.1 geranylgeranyl pyrophosphate synthase [Actinoallomurus iriomotensis]
MGTSPDALRRSSAVAAPPDPSGRASARRRTGALLTAAPHRVVADFAGERRLAADLEECVGGVARAVAGDVPIIGEAVTEILAGGKRLRPLLVLAAAYAGSGERERSVTSGVVVELLHLASLVHDDVMDEAAQRHGVTSANARMGNVRAVLAGDYLLGRALAVACELGGTEGALAAGTFIRLCDGQARESAALFDPARSENDYYAAIEGKTAALFATSCRLGAMAGGLGEEATAALAEYGLQVGMAFQIVDDLLDLTATSGTMGKPAGHDIAEGVYTLPVLCALRERPELAGVLARARPDAPDPEAVREAADIVRNSGGMAAARRAAERRTDRAVAALSGAAGEVGAERVAMLTDLAAALAGRGS